MRRFLSLLALAALCLPARAQSDSRWMSQFEDDRGRRYELDVRGDATFTDDDGAVASLSPDGSLKLLFDGDDGRVELTVRRDGSGPLRYEYAVDGRRIEYDARARERLAPVFLEVIRQSGIQAEARVARILRTNGVDGVIDEIRHIRSSGAATRYFVALVEAADLTTTQQTTLLRMAPERIASSGDRSRFLIRAASGFLEDEGVASTYFETACTVSSSGDRSRVLIHAIETEDLSGTAARDLVRCAATIPSSGDLSRVMVATVPQFSEAAAYRGAWFDAARQISSSGDRSRVLIALAARGDLGEAALLELLDAAKGISSSGDRSRVLVSVAPYMKGDRLVDAYVDTAETVSSSGDRGRALSALMGAN